MKYAVGLGLFVAIGFVLVACAWLTVFGWAVPGCHGVCL